MFALTKAKCDMDYDALKVGLKKLGEVAKKSKATVHFEKPHSDDVDWPRVHNMLLECFAALPKVFVHTNDIKGLWCGRGLLLLEVAPSVIEQSPLSQGKSDIPRHTSGLAKQIAGTRRMGHTVPQCTEPKTCFQRSKRSTHSRHNILRCKTTQCKTPKTPHHTTQHQCGVVWCGAVRCGAVRCGAVLCGGVSTPPHPTPPHPTPHHTTQYCTTQQIIQRTEEEEEEVVVVEETAQPQQIVHFRDKRCDRTQHNTARDRGGLGQGWR